MADKQFNNNYDYQAHILAHQEAGTLKQRVKPVVHFTPTAIPVVVGKRASVITYDHPDTSLNSAPFVHTSVVKKLYENGNFDSTYTSYVLVGNDEFDPNSLTFK